jgi:uncharacterized iron-regulated membrane protein
VRRLILNLHLAIALVAGAFILVLGATGSILALEPQLDRLLHRDVSYVKPGDRVLSLVEIGDAVARKYPGEPVVAYLPAAVADFPSRVILSRGIVCVNQYTGEILGVRTRGQTFLGIIRALHVRLAAGEAGRVVLKWAAVGLLFSLMSGLCLWWPAKPMRIRGSIGSTKFWFDLHGAAGIFSFLPLLALAASGTILGFEDQLALLLEKRSDSPRFQVNPARVPWELRANATEITPDEAVAIARRELPDALPYRVQMPKYGGLYIIALEYRDHRIAGDRNSVSIDPWSGQIVSANLASGLTFQERFMRANLAIHTGSIRGTATRIAAALTGLFVPLQAASGIVLWWRRRRIRRAV